MIPILYVGRKTKINVNIGIHGFSFGAELAAVMIKLLWMGGGGCVLVRMVLVSGGWVQL